MIRTVVRFQNNMVMVFDENGEQITEYQGPYKEVKGSILKDAPIDAVFAQGFTEAGELRKISREEWQRF
jgi:hypothetical protein